MDIDKIDEESIVSQDTRSETIKKSDAFTTCPACGHAARFHWPTKGGLTSDATTREQLLVLRHRNNTTGVEEDYGYADNASPGNLPSSGCFKQTTEYWQTHDSNLSFNVHKFCDCPMDRETVLALVRQGKIFTPKS
jgi:hypothetical protein